jgi:hypothetical protein
MKLRLKKLFVASLIASLASPFIGSPAHAADTVLFNNLVDDCGDCYDHWQVTDGANQWVAFVIQSPSAATLSKVEIYFESPASNFAGSTVQFYSDGTQAPNDASRLLGTLTYASSTVPAVNNVVATFTGSVSIPSAGLYWFRFGNLGAGKAAWYPFGAISHATGTWTAYQGNPNDDFFNGGVQQNLNYYPAIRITGSATSGGGGGGGTTKSASELAAEARKAHDEAAAKALASMKTKISSGAKPSKSDFDSADISGVTDSNITLIQADLGKLSATDRADFSKIKTIVTKYATVDSIADHKNVSKNLLIQVGLMDPTAKLQQLTIATLKSLSSDQLNTFEKIKKEIDALQAIVTARKNRLAERMAKNALR